MAEPVCGKVWIHMFFPCYRQILGLTVFVALLGQMIYKKENFEFKPVFKTLTLCHTLPVPEVLGKYVSTHTHTHIHIYMYIYSNRET